MLDPVVFKLPMTALSFFMGCGVYAYVIYNIIWGELRPNPLTWLGFGLCTAVGALVQYFTNAGPGGWGVMGIAALSSFLITGFSAWKRRTDHEVQKDKETKIPTPSWLTHKDPRVNAMLQAAWNFGESPWWAFWMGLGVFGLWLGCVLTKSGQTPAAILATTADWLLYWPAIRQGWYLPHKDSVRAYVVNSLKFVPGLLVLDSYTVSTVLYPAMLVVMNLWMAWYIIWRERRRGVARTA